MLWAKDFKCAFEYLRGASDSPGFSVEVMPPIVRFVAPCNGYVAQYETRLIRDVNAWFLTHVGFQELDVFPLKRENVIVFDTSNYEKVAIHEVGPNGNTVASVITERYSLDITAWFASDGSSRCVAGQALPDIGATVAQLCFDGRRLLAPHKPLATSSTPREVTFVLTNGGGCHVISDGNFITKTSWQEADIDLHHIHRFTVDSRVLWLEGRHVEMKLDTKQQATFSIRSGNGIRRMVFVANKAIEYQLPRIDDTWCVAYVAIPGDDFCLPSEVSLHVEDDRVRVVTCGDCGEKNMSIGHVLSGHAPFISHKLNGSVFHEAMRACGNAALMYLPQTPAPIVLRGQDGAWRYLFGQVKRIVR